MRKRWPSIGARCGAPSLLTLASRRRAHPRGRAGTRSSAVPVRPGHDACAGRRRRSPRAVWEPGGDRGADRCGIEFDRFLNRTGLPLGIIADSSGHGPSSPTPESSSTSRSARHRLGWARRSRLALQLRPSPLDGALAEAGRNRMQFARFLRTAASRPHPVRVPLRSRFVNAVNQAAKLHKRGNRCAN